MGKQATQYEPKFLGWVKSYEEEVAEFRSLILGKPEDFHLLKQEYYELTGKRFKKRKGE